MKRYVIERDVPSIGSLNAEQLKGAAAKSCDALRAELVSRRVVFLLRSL